MTPRAQTCAGCGTELEHLGRGRPRRTCSGACREAVRRWRASAARERESAQREAELEELRRQVAEGGRRRRSPMLTSDSVEWYTPVPLFERAVESYGPFDLDPAADPRSPLWPLVERHWTVTDDGLAQPWVGRVWCNPPYGRQIGRWTAKAAEEFGAGRASRVVMLVPARPDTRWWNDALDAGAVPEFLRGRVRFVLPGGTRLAGAPFPSALLVFRHVTELR